MSTTDDKHYRARITKRVDFAPIVAIRIQSEGEFKFAPGQYATLVLRPGSAPSARTPSCPLHTRVRLNSSLSCTERRTDASAIQLREGDELLMRKASKGRLL